MVRAGRGRYHAPMQTPSTYLHRLRVPYAHVDQMGFVYYANYLVYFEMARTALLRAAGLPYSELERQGVMLPVLEAAVTYRQAARYEDILCVATRCTELKGVRLRIHYEVRRLPQADLVPRDAWSEPDAGDLLTHGHTVHTCMRPDGRPMRPIPQLAALVAS